MPRLRNIHARLESSFGLILLLVFFATNLLKFSAVAWTSLLLKKWIIFANDVLPLFLPGGFFINDLLEVFSGFTVLSRLHAL